MTELQLRVVCNRCGWHGDSGGSTSTFLSMSLYGNICPDCGQVYDSFDIGQFSHRVMEWHSTSIWCKPWTWGSGSWVKHENEPT